MQNYYHILGLTNFASLTEIKLAFRKLAKQYHPDINANSQEYFKTLVKAYEVLSDPHLKLQFDNKLKYYLNYNQQKKSTPKPESRKTDFDEKELKRRQYYQENYKKNYEQVKPNIELKKTYNEYRNILIATPLAVLLIMILLNAWNTKPQINVVKYKEPEPIKNIEIKEEKRIHTGDTPYTVYYGGEKKDSLAKRNLKVKNLTGNDLIIFLFSKKQFIRTCYIEHGYEINFDYLPKELSVIRIMSGTNFQYTAELPKTGVFGAFTNNLKFYITKNKLNLNGVNQITFINLSNEGFKETEEKEFFESGI